jgi:hypothetical protein
MAEENLSPISPEFSEENTTIKVIAILAIAIILCICICLFVLISMPTLFGPIIGEVMSDVIDEMLLTPVP